LYCNIILKKGPIFTNQTVRLNTLNIYILVPLEIDLAKAPPEDFSSLDTLLLQKAPSLCKEFFIQIGFIW